METKRQVAIHRLHLPKQVVAPGAEFDCPVEFVLGLQDAGACKDLDSDAPEEKPDEGTEPAGDGASDGSEGAGAGGDPEDLM